MVSIAHWLLVMADVIQLWMLWLYIAWMDYDAECQTKAKPIFKRVQG